MKDKKNLPKGISRESLYWFSAFCFIIIFPSFIFCACCPEATSFREPPLFALGVYWYALSLYVGILVTENPPKKMNGRIFAYASMAEFLIILLWFLFPVEILGYCVERFPVNLAINTVVVISVLIGKDKIQEGSLSFKILETYLSKSPIRIS